MEQIFQKETSHNARETEQNKTEQNETEWNRARIDKLQENDQINNSHSASPASENIFYSNH